jgi:hypothetical protein
MKSRLAVVWLLVLPVTATAKDLETTHLFGFTLGTDVNGVGEVEGETETVGRFAKRAGSYSAIAPTLGLKFIPWENFSVEPVVAAAYHGISGVPDLDDRRRLAFDSLSVELRYRLLDREHAPVGLTLGVDPHWGRIDDVSGERVNSYGVDFLIAADRELVADRLFAALNFTYQPEASRSQITGMWDHQSTAGVSAALAVQVQPGVLVGAEVRHLRSFDGLGLNTPTGQASFIGPTLYVKFNERVWMSAAWSVQVAGHAVDYPRALDLVNFERHQAVVRFGYNF